MKTSFEQSTYMKIYHMIANDITIGVYKAGDIIPTQMELAKKYAVSRATISEAIKELTRRKLVKTQRGTRWRSATSSVLTASRLFAASTATETSPAR